MITGMDAKKTLVLLVDDEKDLVEAIADSIPQDLFEVTGVNSAQEALAHLDSRKSAGQPSVDCVVSDWMMPGLNGLELLDRLRSDASHRFVAFVLMSGAVTKEEIASAAQHGPDAVLLKPFKSVDLVEKIIQAKTRALSRQLAGT